VIAVLSVFTTICSNASNSFMAHKRQTGKNFKGSNLSDRATTATVKTWETPSLETLLLMQ
jgi:hypothetical protein